MAEGAKTSVEVRTVLLFARVPRRQLQGVPCPTLAGWETVGAAGTVEPVAGEDELGLSVLVSGVLCGKRDWGGGFGKAGDLQGWDGHVAGIYSAAS